MSHRIVASHESDDKTRQQRYSLLQGTGGGGHDVPLIQSMAPRIILSMPRTESYVYRWSTTLTKNWTPTLVSSFSSSHSPLLPSFTTVHPSPRVRLSIVSIILSLPARRAWQPPSPAPSRHKWKYLNKIKRRFRKNLSCFSLILADVLQFAWECRRWFLQNFFEH